MAVPLSAPPDPLALLSVPEAAEATGLDPRAVRYLVTTRRIPVVRLGRSVFIRRQDLAAAIDAATTPAAVAA